MFKPVLLDQALLDGYTNKMTYAPGETVRFFLNTNAAYKDTILNINDPLGQVVGRIEKVEVMPQQIQNERPYENGYGYQHAVEYRIPDNMESGVYFLGNKVPFLVRGNHPERPLVVLDFSTMNAYSCSGGKSLYKDCKTGSAYDRARAVSFERPMETFKSPLFTFDFLKWARMNNKQYDYIADYEMSNSALLAGRKSLVIMGHSEYWDRASRLNFDQFVDQGGNAAVFSGNTMWWQVRYEGNKMICYRMLAEDPHPDPLQKTINWDQASLKLPILNSIGGDFNLGGFMDPDHSKMGYTITDASHKIFAGTGVQTGDLLLFNGNYPLWGEFDGMPIQGFDGRGFPILDNSSTQFHRLKLLGFDSGSRKGKTTYGTFVAFQKTPASGTVVNAAINVWGSTLISSKNKEKFSKITDNIITLLNDHQNMWE